MTPVLESIYDGFEQSHYPSIEKPITVSLKLYFSSRERSNQPKRRSQGGWNGIHNLPWLEQKHRHGRFRTADPLHVKQVLYP